MAQVANARQLTKIAGKNPNRGKFAENSFLRKINRLVTMGLRVDGCVASENVD
jgi:hypothetical protein